MLDEKKKENKSTNECEYLLLKRIIGLILVRCQDEIEITPNLTSMSVPI